MPISATRTPPMVPLNFNGTPGSIKVNPERHELLTQPPTGHNGPQLIIKPALVQIMAWRLLGQCWRDSLPHICGTRGRWVSHFRDSNWLLRPDPVLVGNLTCFVTDKWINLPPVPVGKEVDGSDRFTLWFSFHVAPQHPTHSAYKDIYKCNTVAQWIYQHNFCCKCSQRHTCFHFSGSLKHVFIDTIFVQSCSLFPVVYGSSLNKSDVINAEMPSAAHISILVEGWDRGTVGTMKQCGHISAH